MTVYAEKNSFSLLSGAYDPDGDPIFVYRVNGSVIASWPQTVSLTEGSVSVTQDGVVTYDDGGDTSGHPSSGSSAANGSFTYTIWDGIAESSTYTCSVQLNGSSAADPVDPAPSTMVPSRASSGNDGITEIALTWDRAIQFASSGTINIWNDDTDALIEALTIASDVATSGAGTMNIVGLTLYVRPTSALPGLTQVSLRIPALVIENTSGVGDVQGTEGGWWNFTTASTAGGDTTPPIISSMTPADGSTGAAINADISLTFNEAIAFGSGDIVLRNVTDGTTIETFDVTTDTGSSAGTVSVAGSVLTIRPTSDFANGKEISVRLDAGAIEDTSGNAHVGVADDTWNFTTAQSGGAASSYQFGSHTPAGQAGIPATSFTPDANNHFTLTSGKIVVTAAGAAANLNLGPYAVTIDGGAESITIISNGIHVSSNAEFDAAVTTAAAGASTDWTIIGRDGTTISTAKTFTNRRWNGTLSDNNVSSGYAIVARASYDWNATASISGGSLTITSDTPGGFEWSNQITLNGCDCIIFDGCKLDWVGTTPGYDLGDTTGFQNQAPWKEQQVIISANGSGVLGDFIFRNNQIGGYQTGVEAPFWKSFIYTVTGASNGAGHVVCEDNVIDGIGVAFELSTANRQAVRRNWTKRCLIDHVRVYHTNSTVTGGGDHYLDMTGNVNTHYLGSTSRLEGVYNPGAHNDWLQIPRQHGSADVTIFVARNYLVADPDGTHPEAEIDTVFYSGNPQGLPNATGYDFSNIQGHAPQGLHSGKTGISVTGELYENVLVINGLNGLTIAGLEVDMTRNIVIEGTNQRPIAIKTGQGLQVRWAGNPATSVTYADNIFPRYGNSVPANVNVSSSVNILEGAASGASNSYATNLTGPFVDHANGAQFTLDTSSPAALKADCAVKFAPRSGSSCDGKGPFG